MALNEPSQKENHWQFLAFAGSKQSRKCKKLRFSTHGGTRSDANFSKSQRDTGTCNTPCDRPDREPIHSEETKKVCIWQKNLRPDFAKKLRLKIPTIFGRIATTSATLASDAAGIPVAKGHIMRSRLVYQTFVLAVLWSFCSASKSLQNFRHFRLDMPCSEGHISGTPPLWQKLGLPLCFY